MLAARCEAGLVPFLFDKGTLIVAAELLQMDYYAAITLTETVGLQASREGSEHAYHSCSGRDDCPEHLCHEPCYCVNPTHQLDRFCVGVDIHWHAHGKRQDLSVQILKQAAGESQEEVQG